jgi:hypothetical protein
MVVTFSNYCSWRNFQLQILAIFPRTVLSTTEPALWRLEPLLGGIVTERIGIFIGHEKHITPFSSVSPIRATLGNVLFTAPAHTPAPSGTSTDVDGGVVEEHAKLSAFSS